MLRFLLRKPRTVRVPVDGSNVDVQTVKFRRQPRSPTGKYLVLGAATFLTIEGIKYLDPLNSYEKRDVFQEQIDKARKEYPTLDKHSRYGKHWDTQHAQIQNKPNDDLAKKVKLPDTVSMTLPIWIRKGPVRPYNVRDPEFIEFAKLQSDKKRMDDLRRQVADSVMYSIQKTGRHLLELKIIAFNGTVTGWLEVVPQPFAPPIYQLPCVWLSAAPPFATFGWRPLHPDTGARIERVFRPLVAFDAATAAARVFIFTIYAITKAKLSEHLRRGSSGSSQNERSQVLIPQIKELEDVRGADQTSDEMKSKKPIFSYFPDVKDGNATRKMHQDIVSAMPYSSAIQQAAAAFNHVKMARQKAAVARNVKGICQIRGYLNFEGAKGRFRLEVVAHYLPSENVFLGAVQSKQSYIVQDYAAVLKRKEAAQKRSEQKKKQKREQDKLETSNSNSLTESDSNSYTPEQSKSSNRPASNNSTEEDKEK